MQLSDILKTDAVKTITSSTSKKRLFHDLADLAQNCYGFNASDVVDALLDRENLGPTGVGHGIALPHARLKDATSVRGIFLSNHGKIGAMTPTSLRRPSAKRARTTHPTHILIIEALRLCLLIAASIIS